VTTAAAKRARPRWRLLARTLTIIIGALLLLAISLVALVQTAWVGRRGGRALAARISADVAGRVTVGQLDVEGTALVLDDVTVTDPREAVVGRIQRVRLDLALWPRWRKRLVVESLDIDRPYVRFVTGSRRAGIIAALSSNKQKPPGGPGTWQIVVEAAHLREGVVEEGPVGDVRARLGDLAISLEGQLAPVAGHFGFDLEIAGTAERPLAGRVKASAHAAGRLRGAANMVLEQAAAGLRVGTALEASARMTEPGHLTVTAERLVVAPAQLRPWLRAWPLASPVSLAGTVQIGPEQIAIALAAGLTASPGTATLEGNVDRDLRRTPDGLRFALAHVPPATALGRGPSMPFDATLEIRPGPLAPAGLSASLSLTAPVARFRRQRWGPVDVAARINEGHLASLRGRIALPGAKLRLGRAHGSDAPASQTPGMNRIEAALFIASLRHLGRGLAALDLVETPSVAGHGKLRVTVRGAPLTSWRALGIAARGSFPWLRAGGRATRGLRVELELPPASSGSRAFHVDASVAAPLDLRLLAAGVRLGGSADRSEPFAVRLDRLRIAYPVRAGLERWRLEEPVRIAAGAAGAHFEGLVLTSDGQRLAIEATPKSGGTRVQAALTGLRLARLPLPATAVAPIGRLDAVLRADVGTAAPLVTADLCFDGAGWGRFRPFDATLAAVYRGGRASGHAELHGRHLRASAEFALPVTLTNARAGLHLIAHLAGTGDPQSVVYRHTRWTGRFDADVSVTGTSAAPDIHVEARLRELRVLGPPAAGSSSAGQLELFAGDATLAVATEERGVAATLRLDDHAASATGTTPATASTLDAHARMSDIDLDLTRLAGDPAERERLLRRPISGRLELRGFDPDWLAELIDSLTLVRGRLGGEMQIGGTLAAPRLEGTLHWRQGRIVVAGSRG
jgi:hypothetical protein